MAASIITREGQSPVIAGTRITIDSLLGDFLDPTVTENEVCMLYGLSPEQVAEARAYILRNPDTILAQHLRIEERLSVGNPPEVIEQARRTHETFLRFKQWLVEREATEAAELADEAASNGHDTAESDQFPSFREWLKQRENQ
jgi:uncharacterized protein (DUF433 family)